MDTQYFLYRFETPERDYRHCNVAHPIVYDGETYAPLPIQHSPPTFSSDFSEARITVTVRQDFSVALNHISHPPPYETRLRIYEVLEAIPDNPTNSYEVSRVEPYWKGKIIRPRWRASFSRVEITCKTLADVYFDKESNNESLHPLCRYMGPNDPRCPVNWENYKETGVVEEIGTDTVEPIVTVSGLTRPVPLYKAGMVRAPDGDLRVINLDEESETDGWRDLTLGSHFPASTLQVGDQLDVFLGDDLTFETCVVLYGGDTENGAAHGGWQHTPSRDPQRVGVIG
jgi:hypothetical protein